MRILSLCIGRIYLLKFTKTKCPNQKYRLLLPAFCGVCVGVCTGWIKCCQQCYAMLYCAVAIHPVMGV